MTTTTITNTRNIQPDTTGIGDGIEIAFDLAIGDESAMACEATLVWEAHNSRWAPYGTSVDMWLSGNAIDLLADHCDDEGAALNIITAELDAAICRQHGEG